MEGDITAHQMTGSITKTGEVTGNLQGTGEVSGSLSVPPGRTVAEDYDRLRNRPIINGITIEGDKVSEDYKLQGKMEFLTQQEIERILYIDD